MKRIIPFSILLFSLLACNDSTNEKAEARLQIAREAFLRRDYNETKIQLDSIKILYPKAIHARKEAVRLFKETEQAEQYQTIAYLDSVLAEKEKAFDAIKGRFVLEKDAEYQEVGNYFYPTQTVERNLHRSFLRFQVSERGEMVMTSIYCGSNSIHHTAVKVSEPDESFAETPASTNIYETSHLNEKIEKADFKLGEDGNVMEFIYLNREKNLKVEYLGERKHTTTLSTDDRKALTAIYELTQILSSIEQIKSELKEAHLKLKFVHRKLDENPKEAEG